MIEHLTPSPEQFESSSRAQKKKKMLRRICAQIARSDRPGRGVEEGGLGTGCSQDKHFALNTHLGQTAADADSNDDDREWDRDWVWEWGLGERLKMMLGMGTGGDDEQQHDEAAD